MLPWADRTVHIKVIGSRFTDKYLQSRYTSSSSYSRTPVVPPREKETPVAAPTRHVVTEFASFSAAPAMSFAETPLSTLPSTADDDLAQSVELKFASISLEQVSSSFISPTSNKSLMTLGCRLSESPSLVFIVVQPLLEVDFNFCLRYLSPLCTLPSFLYYINLHFFSFSFVLGSIYFE